MMFELAVTLGFGFVLGGFVASWLWIMSIRKFFIELERIYSEERREGEIENINNVSSQTVEETPVRGSSPNGGSKRTVH